MSKENRIVNLILRLMMDQDNNFFKMKNHFRKNPKDTIDILTLGNESERYSKGSKKIQQRKTKRMG